MVKHFGFLVTKKFCLLLSSDLNINEK